MNRKIISFLLSISLLTPSYSFMHFNGATANVTVGNPALFQVTGAITTSAWIYWYGDQAAGIIFAKESFPSRGFSFKLDDNPSGNLSLIIYSDVAGTTFNEVSEANSFPANEWHHVCAVYIPSTSLTVYRDGIQTAQVTSSVLAAQYNGSNNLVIGQRQDAVQPFHGEMDDIRFYNRALSAQEIQSLATSRSRLTLTNGLIGWWKLDDAKDNTVITGALLKDSSGNGNPGTATGPLAGFASSEIHYP